MNSTGQYYYNARWYDPNLGRFTTEDPIRSGLIWYAYANNNPLRFVDPTGLFINNITDFQKQNTGENKNASLGVPGTYYWNKYNRAAANTVGNFGCLLVSSINIANTESGNGISASSISSNTKYFNIYNQSKSVSTIAGEVRLSGGKDVLMDSEKISSLLKHMTGTDYFVERIREDSPVQEMLKEISEMEYYGVYIIADVDGHFVNLTDYSRDDEGNTIISYYDPYERSVQKSYSAEDIKGYYMIEDAAQHSERFHKTEDANGNIIGL